MISRSAKATTGAGGLVLRADHDGVATLTLNRPDKLNALTPGVFVALRAHLDALDGDDGVRVVVLTGAGTSFSAGHDLTAIASGAGDAHDGLEASVIDQLERLPRPTIAKIRGHCYTGGLELALGCDLLVAGTGARLGDTHGQWGLVPVWGMSVRLPERVGVSRAKQLMFTSRRISAARAGEIGLVDEVVPDDELDAAVDTLAAEICANSAGTNRIVKRLLRERMDRNRPDALAYERSSPHGVPEDMAERMARPRKG